MIIHDVVQGSEEWLALRLGRATSSRAGDMLAKGRGGKGIGAAQLRYRNELVVERLNGVSAERPWSGNRHTERGHDLESDAVMAWEARTGTLVMPVGFVAHDSLHAGCSPDGVVYGDALAIEATIEVKAPIQAIHYETLRTREIVDKAYRAQLMHSIWLTGARIGIYLSYCPAFSEPDDLVDIELLPTADELAAHEAAVCAFLASVNDELQARKPIGQQLEESS